MFFRINFVYGATTEIERVLAAHRQRSEHKAAITALAVDYQAAINEYVADNLVIEEAKAPRAVNADILAQEFGRETGGRLERMSRSLGNGGQAEPLGRTGAS